MTAPQSRPRVVTAAFWCWVVAAVALVALGLLLALNQANLPVFLRASGAVLAVAGLALGYLARQAVAGHTAFRRAAVALALALVFVLALFILIGGGGILWVLPMILALVGAVLMTRPGATPQEETQ
jgi:hypothetical protein